MTVKAKESNKQFIFYVTNVHEHACEIDIQPFKRCCIIEHYPAISFPCSFGLDLNSKKHLWFPYWIVSFKGIIVLIAIHFYTVIKKCPKYQWRRAMEIFTQRKLMGSRGRLGCCHASPWHPAQPAERHSIPCYHISLWLLMLRFSVAFGCTYSLMVASCLLSIFTEVWHLYN